MKKVRALLAAMSARQRRRVSPRMRLVRVAVPVPALDRLTYSVPDRVPTPVVGARVLVPLGSRVLTGFVVESADRRNSRRHRPSSRSSRSSMPSRSCPPTVVELATWVAEYYACWHRRSARGGAAADGRGHRAWRARRADSGRYAWPSLTVQGLEAAGDAGRLDPDGAAAARSARAPGGRARGTRDRRS